MLDLKVSQRIATLTLQRAPANAINREWTERVHQVLDQLDERDDWTVLHIRSGLRLFSAGADIKEMRIQFASAEGIESLTAAVRDYQNLFARIEALSRITLAEIGGAAMGGGFELALSCDLRVVANEALVGLPEIRIGLLAGAGGTQRLTRLCGKSTALRILAGAEMVDGATAVQLGMAQWNFPARELPAAAATIASRYASQSPLASKLVKQCVTAALDPTSNAGFDLEYTASKQLLNSADTQGLVARFLASQASRSKTVPAKEATA